MHDKVLPVGCYSSHLLSRGGGGISLIQEADAATFGGTLVATEGITTVDGKDYTSDSTVVVKFTFPHIFHMNAARDLTLTNGEFQSYYVRNANQPISGSAEFIFKITPTNDGPVTLTLPAGKIQHGLDTSPALTYSFIYDTITPSFSNALNSYTIPYGDALPTLTCTDVDHDSNSSTFDAVPASFDSYALGTRDVIYTCTDPAGNSVSHTAAITVVPANNVTVKEFDLGDLGYRDDFKRYVVFNFTLNESLDLGLQGFLSGGSFCNSVFKTDIPDDPATSATEGCIFLDNTIKAPNSELIIGYELTILRIPDNGPFTFTIPAGLGPETSGIRTAKQSHTFEYVTGQYITLTPSPANVFTNTKPVIFNIKSDQYIKDLLSYGIISDNGPVTFARDSSDPENTKLIRLLGANLPFTNAFTITSNPASDGTVTLSVPSISNIGPFGNSTKPLSFSYVYDTTDPTFATFDSVYYFPTGNAPYVYPSIKCEDDSVVGQFDAVYVSGILTSPNPDTQHLTYSCTDKAGNSATAEVSFQVRDVADTTPPAAPAITNSTGIVTSSPVSIVGTAENNSVVELFKGGTSVGTTTASSSGAFTFSDVALAEGANSFTAKATDAANNKSPASTAVVITLNTLTPPDTTPPVFDDYENGDTTHILLNDPGFALPSSITCTDNIDGSLNAVASVSTIDITKVITHQVTYSCTDSSSNVASIVLNFRVSDHKIHDNTEFSIDVGLDYYPADEPPYPDVDLSLRYIDVTISDIATDDKFALSNGAPELTASQNGQDLKWSDALIGTVIENGNNGKKNFVLTFDYYGACMVDTDANVDFGITFRDSDNVKVGLETFLIPDHTTTMMCPVTPEIHTVTSAVPVSVTLDYGLSMNSRNLNGISVSDGGSVINFDLSENAQKIYFDIDVDVPKGTSLTVTIPEKAFYVVNDFFSDYWSAPITFDVIYGSETETTTLDSYLQKILNQQEIPPLVKFATSHATVNTVTNIPYQRDNAQPHEVIVSSYIADSEYYVSRVNDASSLAISYGSSAINSVRSDTNYKIDFLEGVDIEDVHTEFPTELIFYIDKSKLDSNLNVDDLYIFHFADGRWQQLPTTFTESSSSLSAAPVGKFSPFAIGYLTSTLVSDPAAEQKKKKSGGGNDWHKKPTFGKSHLTQKQILDNGFSFNGHSLTITDNWHTDFLLTSSIIGESNTVTIKTYSADPLKWVDLHLGVPRQGGFSEAESNINLVVSRNYTNPVDYTIDEINHYQKENLIDESDTTASVNKVKCQSTDNDEKCYEFTILFAVNAPLLDNVVAISAMDEKRRQHVTYINEGVEFTGESLLDARTAELLQKKTNQGPVETIQLTQQDRRYNVWEDQHGYLWSQNEYGTWMQTTHPDFERFSDGTSNVMTRQNSNFASLIEHERQKALLVFDSSNISSQVGDYFAYDYSDIDRDTSKLEKYYLELQIENDKALKFVTQN